VERSDLAKRFFIARWERERAERAKSLLLLCWGYIGTFTKVIAIYQIHHSWFHLSIILPHSPSLIYN
jgi:hypothetical protein